MKLTVDMSVLLANVDKMGAKTADVPLRNLKNLKNFKIQPDLSSGKEVQLSDIKPNEGLLIYEGRQVLLYIPDQGRNIEKVIAQPTYGKKFHVADCKTLVEMRMQGRYERYFVTNNMSGYFDVYGTTREGVHQDANLPLNVCQNCLKKLNYKGFLQSRGSIVRDFELNEFFSTYSSLFKYYPKKNDSNKKNVYTKDWDEVSSQLRAKVDYCCQHCKVSLKTNKNLLHTHHINGVKSDNSISNLIALCADCHRKEPYHEHMFVAHADVQTINKLRREQGVVANNWDEVFQYADPACHGLISQCKAMGKSPPEVGFEIVGSDSQVIAEFELAWPQEKVAIVFNKTISIPDWKIYGLDEYLTLIIQ